jgi:hypothetical protein
MPKVPAQPPVIRLRLEDSSGEPFRETLYGLEWREVPGHHVTSQTDADGVLTEQIPPGCKTATLSLLDPEWTVVIAVTSFGDASTMDGFAARLENLGMLALPPSTALTSVDPHDVAIAAYRYRALKGLDLSAKMDTVQARLVADHDKV